MNPIHDQNVSHHPTYKLTEVKISDLKLALRSELDVQNLARSISVQDSIQILEFGKESAVEVSRFSDQILASMKMNNLEDLGRFLKQLGRIMDRFDRKDFEKTSEGLFSRLFKKREKMLERLFNKYQSIGKEIDQIYVQISKYQNEMIEMTSRLERLYEENYQYYMTLEKYIVAGELRVSEWKSNQLHPLELQASNGDPVASMELESLTNAINLLEQRIYDLETVKMVALQTAPQIKLLQNVNSKLVNKINSAFVTTIPIFKNGMIQAVSAKRDKLVDDSMKELDRRTKDMMIRNAQNNSRQNVEIAGITGTPSIKVETIEKCYEIIMKGLQETRSIEEENRKLRYEGQLRLLELQQSLESN